MEDPLWHVVKDLLPDALRIYLWLVRRNGIVTICHRCQHRVFASTKSSAYVMMTRHQTGKHDGVSVSIARMNQ